MPPAAEAGHALVVLGLDNDDSKQDDVGGDIDGGAADVDDDEAANDATRDDDDDVDVVVIILLLLFAGGDGDVDITDCTDVNILFQLILTRLRGGPIGGICCVARARNASFIRCGCVVTMFFQPDVSITSVAWVLMKSIVCAFS